MKVSVRLKVSIFILLLLLCPSFIFSQSDLPQVKYYTLEDGISQVSSNDLLLDSSGFVWIATQDGLNKFDGSVFKHYRYDKQDSLTLSGNLINKLFEDSTGKIWVGTIGNGLNYYDPERDVFHRVKLKQSSASNEIISALFEDNQHNIWVGSRLSGLHKLIPSPKGKFTHEIFLKGKAITGALYDDQNNIWIGDNTGSVYRLNPLLAENKNPAPISRIQGNVQAFYKTGNQLLIGGDFGLHRYDIATQKTALVELGAGEELPTKHVLAFLKNDARSVWIGTGNGMYLFNWADGRILKKILYSEDSRSGLSNGTVQALLKISENQLLVGTANYPNLIDLGSQHFKNISKNLRGAHLLNDNVVFSIFKDGDDLWIGTSDGGLNLIRQRKAYYFTYKQNTPNGISGTVVRAIVKDDVNQRLWLATTRGLNMIDLKTFDPNKPKFSVFQHDPNNANSINGDFLKDLVLDQNNNLWGATYGHGVFRLEYVNDQDYKIVKYKNSAEDQNSLSNDFSHSIKADKENNIWIGTQLGLSKLSFSTLNYGKPIFANFSKVDEEESSLAHNSVYDILIDKKDRLWLGTRQGFSQYLGNGRFKSWSQQKQFSNDVIYSIQDDHHGNLWMGTNDGIVKYDPTNDTFKQFAVEDGIQSKEFDIHARFRDNEGVIYLGGIGGVTYFKPEDLEQIDKPQQLYFSELQLKGKTERVDTTSNAVLRRPLDKTERLEFKYDQFPFFLQFSSIDYRINRNVEYAYKLLPTDTEWIFLKEQQIQFLNLPSGSYTLQVNGFSRGEKWDQAPLEMKLEILPPWWYTWWAFLLYGALTLALVYGLYRFQLSKRLALSESARLKEVNQLKSSLYDNITHEFRTPLTVIIGMTDSLENDLKANATLPMQKAMEMIRRNGHNLLSLINEMLDLSKLESGHLEKNMVQVDVVPFIKYLGESFHSFAQKDDIHFTVYSEIDTLMMDVDSDKLSAIISNLLSNAIKFTPASGKIVLHLYIENEVDLGIKISDTGIGISEEQLPHVFNRFYQADAAATRKREGTGIGLALTKELVDLLGGKISVKSIPAEGSVFKVLLPIAQNAPKKAVDSWKDSRNTTLTNAISEASDDEAPLSDTELPLLLIIEDNKDVAYYLKRCLTGQYKVMHAVDGVLGLEMAYEHIPDIIISDVMMPGKDGYEVCGILKEDERTDHIPIILLTAKANIEDRITGLNRGADAYLSKPFVKEELFARLDQLVLLRKKLISKLEKKGLSSLLDEKIEHPQAKFLQQVINIIHAHLEGSDFGAKDLSLELHISESQVYRKLKAVTGKSSAVFIRSVRLQKAKELIQTTDRNISEIAYDTGFNDPSWFSRAYKDEFGFAPSETTK